MKTIDTLVEDIYDLFEPEEDIELSEEEVDAHLDSFAKSIKETMKNILNEKPRERRNLRLSAIGKPARQLWYEKNSKEES
jgi:predicted component of type VI protein secretion system